MSQKLCKLLAAFIAVLSAAVPAASAYAAPVFNSPADVKAITAIEEDIATETSMKGLIHYFAPHAVIVDFFAPGVYKGRGQIYSSFQAQMAGMKSLTHRTQEIDIMSDGNFACDALEISFDIALKNGQTMKLSFRQLDSFQKFAGTWQLVQQHISLPADPKTGMMVMDGPLPDRGPVDWSGDPAPGAATSPGQAEAEIRQWLKGNSEISTSDQLMQYFVPNDALLYNEYFPGELRGRQEIGTNYAPLLNSIASANVTMPMVAVTSDGLLGAQIDTQNAALIMKDGSKHNISLRQSDCLRRVDGNWYSMFEMVSYALDAKTGKAIIDSP